MNSGFSDSPSIKCQRLARRADERIKVRDTYPYSEKLFFKAGEPQVSQRHENVERKREYYHISIFLDRNQLRSASENQSDGPL
jgi:hypothetical protein